MCLMVEEGGRIEVRGRAFAIFVFVGSEVEFVRGTGGFCIDVLKILWYEDGVADNKAEDSRGEGPREGPGEGGDGGGDGDGDEDGDGEDRGGIESDKDI